MAASGPALVPVRWREFQHYRDRCPPWVKVHRELLTDRPYMGLPLAAKGLLTMLWLLASEHPDGKIEADAAAIAWRLRLPEEETVRILYLLVQNGLLEDASNMLATCLQVAPRSPSPSPSASASVEEESEGEPRKARSAAVDRPEDVPEQTWLDWLAHRKAKRATVSTTVLRRLRTEADAAGITLAEALETSVAQGWQGFRADWYAKRNGSSNDDKSRFRNGYVPNRLKPGESNVQPL